MKITKKMVKTMKNKIDKFKAEVKKENQIFEINVSNRSFAKVVNEKRSFLNFDI